MNCGRSSSVEWKLPKLQRRVRFPSPAPFSAWPRAGRFCYAPLRARVRMRMRMRMRMRIRMRMRMRIGYRHADRLISYPDAHNLSVKQQPIRAHRQGCNDAVGVKGAGGTGGPGRGAGGRRQGLAGHLLTCRGPAAPQAPPVWRAAEGQEGQTAAPMGGDGAWQSCSQPPSPTGAKGTGGTGGPGCGARGGGGAWLGFEATRRAKLAARTARGRAAAHGHNQQPGPTAHHAAPGTPVAPQAATQRKRAADRQGRRAFTQLVHTLDTVESWGH